MFQGFVHVALELIVFPFFIGVLTERLASRKWLFAYTYGSPRVWNVGVKLLVSWWSAKHIVFVDRVGLCGDDGGYHRSNRAAIESWMEWLLVINDVKDQCSNGREGLFLISCCLRLLSFCISARLGSSLQPVSITGSIATGKSTVCNILMRKYPSFYIIDLDKIGHDILIPGKLGPHDCAYDRIVKLFGDDILESKKDNNTIIDDDTEDEDEKEKSSNYHRHRRLIDRRKLGDVIFRDVSKRRLLNKITHPLISKIMIKRIVQEGYFSNDNNIVCVDCPLLFEIGFKMKALFGIKIVVACSPRLQLERLVQRNPDLTREQCYQRILSQIPINDKVHMADIVIWNNGSFEELEQEVKKAYQEVQSRVIGYGFSFSQITLYTGILLIATTATLHL